MNSIYTLAQIAYPTETKFLMQDVLRQNQNNSFSHYPAQQFEALSDQVICITDENVDAEETM